MAKLKEIGAGLYQVKMVCYGETNAQLTVPRQLRQVAHYMPGQYFAVRRVGECLVFAPLNDVRPVEAEKEFWRKLWAGVKQLRNGRKQS